MRAEGPATWVSPLPACLFDLFHHALEVFFFLVEAGDLFFGELFAAMEAAGELAEAGGAPTEPGGEKTGEDAGQKRCSAHAQRDPAIGLVAKGGFEPIHVSRSTSFRG